MDAAAAAGERAARLLPGLGFPAGTTVGGAIPVQSDAGTGERWFVPAVRGDDLVGFLDFDGAVLRRSSFLPSPAPAGDWLDRAQIRARAERFSGRIVRRRFGRARATRGRAPTPASSTRALRGTVGP